MTSTSNSTAPYTGQLIANRFQVKHLISQGAMGAVYYAEDAQQKEKPVAVKFLSQSLENEEMQRRFAREAGIGARLGKKSSHIVQVISWGMHEEKIPFYVMEFLSGKSLKAIFQEQSLTLSRFFTLCRQLCLGLSVAHQGIEINGVLCPVIHRDIKPANILISSDPAFGELLKILDFGIAKLVGDQVKLTQARAFLGTLAYSSPEQMEGRSLDNRSDIYSLGVVMFEMLTRHSPWEIENIKSYGAWYRIHHSQAPRAFKDVNPDKEIPDELEKLVRRCLAKTPSERPSSIEEVLKTLSDIESQSDATLIATRTAINEEQMLEAADDVDSVTMLQDYNPQDKNQTLKFDDADLIQRFARGEKELVANQNLQINYSVNRLQLTTRKLEILAFLDLLQTPKLAWLKPLSKYGGLIHKIILENNFFPWGESSRQGFVKYRQYEVPAGYELQYTEMGVLWKIWWPKHRHKSKHEIKIDIMVSIHDSWYPIHDIVSDNGIFYIKTIAGEMKFNNNDKLVWSSLLNREKIANTQITTNPIVRDSEAENSTGKSKQMSSGSVGESKPASHQPEVKPAPESDQLLKSLKARAMRTMANYLLEGETTTITEVMKNSQGEIIHTKTTTVKKPCPQWVIEYLLSKNQIGNDEVQTTAGEEVKNPDDMGESPLMWLL